MGRKSAVLDYTIIDTALFFGATTKQLQVLLERQGTKYDVKTIERCVKRDKKQTFKQYRDYCMGETVFKLKQTLIKKALAGDNTALIFCLKNMSDWADKQEVSNSGPDKIEITYKEKK